LRRQRVVETADVAGRVERDADDRRLREVQEEALRTDVLAVLEDVLVVRVVRQVLGAAEDLAEPALLLAPLDLLLREQDLGVRDARPAGLGVEHDLDQLVGDDVQYPGEVFGIEAQRFRPVVDVRSEEHTSELQSRENLVCRLLLEKKKKDT